MQQLALVLLLRIQKQLCLKGALLALFLLGWVCRQVFGTLAVTTDHTLRQRTWICCAQEREIN
jgi:hypothetical protein